MLLVGFQEIYLAFKSLTENSDKFDFTEPGLNWLTATIIGWQHVHIICLLCSFERVNLHDAL